MKLRQKLATVLATAMVVTAVPVITSATTTNTISISSVSIVKDGEVGFTSSTNATSTTSTYSASTNYLTLDVAAKAAYQLGTTGQSFFVEIDNAEFSDAAYYAAATGNAVTVNKAGYIVDANGVATNVKVEDAVKTEPITGTVGDANYEITKVSDTELKVKVTGSIAKDKVIPVPVFAVAKSGEITLTVDGTDTFVSSTKHVLGATSSKSIVAAATEATTISADGGEVADILVSEATMGAMKSSTDKVIKINLSSSVDAEFGSLSNVKLVGKKGFDGLNLSAATITLVDEQSIEIDLSGVTFTGTSRGQISIEGIEVVPENKTITTEKIEVTVKNKNMENTKLTIAEVKEEAVSLTVEEVEEVVAGKDSETVTFTLEENTKDAIIDGRKADFTVENGFIAVRNYNTTTSSYDSALKTVKDLVNAGDIVLPDEVTVSDIVDAEANNEGQITGFTVQFNHLDANEASELEFEMPIMADINTTGDVKLTVDGRAIQKSTSTTIATVKAPFEVKAEAVELKTGLNSQVGGKLTITETDAEMFDKGEVTITMQDNSGITFKKDQDLAVKAENLSIKDVKVYADAITFNVERTSDEAGSIEIENIEFNVDRTAPQGTFDLEIAGDAISTNVYMKAGLETLTVADFVQIGTKNTEDITGSNGLAAGTATFSIGATTYTVNGEERTMTGAAYLSNGRTMMPVRYVSEAFGIAGDNIMFNNGVVTVIAGSRIVQLTNGSNVATLNGVSIAMDEKVTIKDGRTYIPVGEVARLLGISVKWDNETKTATFTN